MTARKMDTHKKNAFRLHPKLTDRQVDIMIAIQTWQAEHDYSPSYREIGTKVHLTVAPVAHQIKQLVSKGYLIQNGRRNLIVVKRVRLDRNGFAR